MKSVQRQVCSPQVLPNLANMPDFRKNLTRFSRLNSAYEREVKVYDLHLRNSKDRRSENGQRKKRI